MTGPGDQINTDPLLGPLQDNGGPTFTHALLPGSPAINAGDPNFTPPPVNDQRGCHFDRVFNGRIDIGAFEAQPPRRPCPDAKAASNSGTSTDAIDDSPFPDCSLFERSDQREKFVNGKIPSIRESSFEVLTEKEWES